MKDVDWQSGLESEVLPHRRMMDEQQEDVEKTSMEVWSQSR